MNQYEADYLLQNNITLLDWSKLLELVGDSRYLKVSTDFTKVGLTKAQFEKLRAKLKKADIIKEVKGDLRVNPYFYLRNDAVDSVINKLQKEYNLEENAEAINYPETTDEDGVIYMYDKKLKRYREKTVADFKNEIHN